MNKNLENNNDQELAKFPKNPGFNIPEGYFDQVEDIFSLKIKEGTFPKNHGFYVDKEYFNFLEDDIISQVQLPKKEKVIPLRAQVLRYASIAAVLIIGLFVGKYIINTNTISYQEAEVWLENNVQNISTEDFLAYLDDEDFEDTALVNQLIDTDEINNYLDENDTYILIQESDIILNELN